MKSKVVVLASGGFDSSVMLYFLIKKELTVYPLFVNYGQPYYAQEKQAIQKICKYLRLNLEEVEVSNISQLNLSDKNGFFPCRNAYLLLLGTIYASKIRANLLSMGIIKPTATEAYPDTSKSFLQDMQKVIDNSVKSKIKLFLPFINLSKNEILVFAYKNKFPFELTYSCYKGKAKPCGKCAGCRGRLDAFKLLKIQTLEQLKKS